ncbi:MAG TPA: hypothetical protein VHV55_09705 [Pirellulales bacterium]|jgi:hypothetical protein|nr:hypothetical protein [Pirellulales bacterium]
MWRKTLGAMVLSSLLASSALAEDPAIEGFYGSGVEAYYTGDYIRAFNLLNAAVQAGTHDPRVYYFRGLAETFLGRSPDAVRDFQKGAEFESSDASSVVDVGRSLERVQGPTRLLLERYRAAARLAAVAERQRQRLLRYGQVRPAPVAVARPAGPVGGAPAAGAPAAAAPAGAPPAQQPAADDPFAAPAATPQKPAAEDPFAAPPAAGKPAAPAAEDPFAAPPPK